MKIILQRFLDNLKDRKPGTIGAVAGFALALSLILFGLLKTLLLIGMTALGYFIGVRFFSDREAFRNLLDKILPPGLFH